MSDATNDSNSSFLAGFVMGGMVGAAIALIFAPQSGSHTRASFANRGVTLQRSVNQKRMVNGTTDGSYFGDEGKHDATTTYEAPRIILDESNRASTPPDKV